MERRPRTQDLQLAPALLGLLLASGCHGFIEDLSTKAGPTPVGPDGSPLCVPGIAPRSRVPRLTHSQLDNTVRELFGNLSLEPSRLLPPEAAGSLDARGWSGYQTVAATLAEAAVSDSTIRDRIVPCSPAAGDQTCAKQFISSFGRRAFRRPLSADEVARYLGLFDQRASLTSNGTFDEAIQLIVEAFLQSPSFLSRVERSTEVIDGSIPLDAYEVASNLSYALWNSMPDDALFEAAERGDLLHLESVRAQAERMLADPRARDVIREFHDQWLGIQGSQAAQWFEIVRHPDRFPDYTGAMAPLLVEETRRFVEHVVFDRSGGFQELLNAPVGFVNQDLAPLYGLNPANYEAELVAIDLDPTRRAGVFTRLGFLASHAMYDRTSPILRGAFLADHVLCRKLGPPPPDAEMTPLPPSDSTLVTTRDRVTQQTSPPACAGCHETLINPLGFAFEHYDAVGAWRETENGAAIDASGRLTLDGEDVAFQNGRELSAAIASSREAQLCYARQWVEFIQRREPTGEDTCAAEQVAARLADPGYGITDLLIDLTQNPNFVRRAEEEETER